MISKDFQENPTYIWLLLQLVKEIYPKTVNTSIKNYSTNLFQLITLQTSNLLLSVLEIHLMYSTTKQLLSLMIDLKNLEVNNSLKEVLEMINMMKNMKPYGKIGHQICLMKLNFQFHQMFYSHQVTPLTLLKDQLNKDHLSYQKIING